MTFTVPRFLSLAALLVTAVAARRGAAGRAGARRRPGSRARRRTGRRATRTASAPSRTARSKVWYTLNDGVLTEVFSPRIDTPATRDTQLVVTDGATFADREDEDTDHRVELLDARSPVYRQVNTAKSGKYRITKTYVTDPAARRCWWTSASSR